MQSSLDDAYAERSELSRLLDDVQRKRHRLEEERAMLQRKVEAFHLPSLGASEDVPPLLRTEHPVVAREISPERLRSLVADFFQTCTDRLDGGTYPEVQAVFLDVLCSNFERQAMAEVGRAGHVACFLAQFVVGTCSVESGGFCSLARGAIMRWKQFTRWRVE